MTHQSSIGTEQIRERLSELLGPGAGEISDDVVLAVVDDPLYLHHLLISRQTPAFLRLLLDSPPETAGASPVPRSAAKLSRQAASSFWKWAKSGFEFVPDEQYERRLAACRQCPHLTDPPQSKLYDVATVARRGDDRKICDLCGCVVASKARIPSETCPDPRPGRGDVNRWGEKVGSPQ
ncbi:hypothetical protein OUY22_00385 [Nonomuraea sp. MCN248]|uniref:Uncharacterized protein n=1 Tax=Nonomuraea corallina TaxID=2989783 RepID=A0ABT4S4M8_9ACTN|nr:hypothetical protein [Nonomuraea corallina]MDA0631860.1 hypothetical protein [Nonomuraea corallina]